MSFCKRGLLVSSLLLLSACASLTQKKSSQNSGESGVEGARAEIAEKEDSSEEVEKKAEMPYKSAYGDIPMDYNVHVEKWIRYFTGKGRKHMKLYLERSTRYLPMMKNVLRENGLPEDLVYIALIESGFSPRAHSRANAVGYWQFIRGTGRRFGLKLDTFIDERRDPVLSTRAAAEYFKTLYNFLGSWHLAMAAYNVGEMRVKRAVTRYYTRDFWELIKKRRSFPAETKNYVPKFIAAAMIAKNPERYGFTDLQFEDPLSYDTVTLQNPISLSKLAANLSVDVDELKLLNPKFRTDFVPISRNNETVVRIPVGRATDALAALPMSVTTQPKVVQAEYFYYRIRRGDNLSTIAKRYRTTVSRLRRLNNLSNRAILRPGRRLRVPDNGGDGIKLVTEEDAAGKGARNSRSSVRSRDVKYHVVRRGENLTTIAQKYGTSVSELRRLNQLGSRSLIRLGQKLRVQADSAKTTRMAEFSRRKVAGSDNKRRRAPSSSKAAKLSNQNGRVRKHLVRRGETLWDLSKKYRVTVRELAKANGLKVNHRVMAGQKLLIPD